MSPAVLGLLLLAVANIVGFSLMATAIFRPSRETVSTVRRSTKCLLVAAAVIQAAVVFSAFRIVADRDALAGEVAQMRAQIEALRDEMKQHHEEFAAERDHLTSLAVDSMSGELRLTNAHEDLKRQVELIQSKIQFLHPDQAAHTDDQPKESTAPNDDSNQDEQRHDTSNSKKQEKEKKIRMHPGISDVIKAVQIQIQIQANKMKNVDLIKAVQIQANKMKRIETSLLKKAQNWRWKPST